MKSKLQFEQKNVYMEGFRESDINSFCDGYKSFLNIGKTERQCAAAAVKMLDAGGFHPYTSGSLSPGDRCYTIYKGKVTIAFIAGRRSLCEGVNLAASHVDSPRLDLKPHPLYEEQNLCMMKTHYYGGIKKYQWATIPLMLTGTVIKSDGTMVDIQIGDKDNDPIFYISDLLPHLASQQMERKLKEGIKGEELNVLAGIIPCGQRKRELMRESLNTPTFSADDEDEDEISAKIKENILSLLNDRYGIVEEDFITAELTLVPSYPARDAGLDRSMIAAYGHDDKVCAYTTMKALIDTAQSGIPEKTCVCVWADKEEIGSMGVSGMQSDFLINFLRKLCSENDVNIFDALDNSICLSADVDAAYDPTFANAYDVKNSAKFGNGIVLTKYTGARGKSGTSDASAETAGKVRKIFNDAGVIWQMGELGKIDIGGGGTVAQFIANKGIDTIDCGVPVISMHAPYELVCKADVFMAYKGYEAFYLSC